MPLREELPQTRAEQLIAWSRLALPFAALGAIAIDPLERGQEAAAGVLACYAAYALLLVAWNRAAASYDARLPLVSHVIDLFAFAVLYFLTGAIASPLAVLFVFPLFCSTFRFGRAGLLTTAALILGVFVVSTALAWSAGISADSNRLIIRSVCFGVIAYLLVEVVEHQQRANETLSRIARWPRTPWTASAAVVRQLLEEGAAVLGAGRILMAFDDGTGQRAFLGRTLQGRFEALPQSDEVAADVLGPPDSFLMTRTARGRLRILRQEGPHLVRIARPPLGGTLVEDLGLASVVAVSFTGDFVRGRLLVLDLERPTQEGLTLAQIVADMIGGRLDHVYAVKQLERGAVAEERVRVARDLHDSILQSLTGAALQLQTIPRMMLRKPAEATARVSEIQHVIASDQRELRSFIDSLQASGSGRSGPCEIERRLESLRARFRHHWNLEVDFEVDPRLRFADAAMQLEVYSIVSEAIANAAKHASPTRVRVTVRYEGSRVAIAVEDDGVGFPFHGRFTLAALLASQRGPVTLKERIASLDGDMLIESTPRGSRIDVTIPVLA